MKIWGILLLILTCLPIVYSEEGRTFDLDFNAHKQYDLWLKKSDRVLFEYGGYNNTIIIDEINNESVELDVFLFLERWLHTPEYVFLDKKYNLRLDFDKDNEWELEIALIKMSEDKKRVNLIFNRLDAWDSNKILKFDEKETINPKKRQDLRLGIIGLGVIIILIIGALTVYYVKKKKEIYF